MKKSILLTSAVSLSMLAGQAYGQETNADEPVAILDTIQIYGTRAENQNIIDAKRGSDGISDFLSADDIGKLPDLNIAESLRRIPGVTSIFDEDRGRFVVVRGLNSNLNYVTIDGIGIATTDSFGGTGRKVNLEVIPASAVSQLEVRKTFTPEVDSGAIGGYVNLKTRSAYDVSGEYLVAEAGINHFTFDDVPGDNSYAGDPYEAIGFQFDGTYSNTFGLNDEFGLVVSGSFLRTSRDEAKDIQAGERYYDDAGNRLTPVATDGTVNPDWNGFVAPEEVRSYDYTNRIEDYGLNVKGEFRPNERLYMSLLAMYYAETQQETRNTVQFQGLDGISNQTATSGDMVIPGNGVRIGWNRNNLERENKGLIFKTDYAFSDLSEVSFVTGWTYNNFDDYMPLIDFRGAPTNPSISYTQTSSDPQTFTFNVADVSGVLDPSTYSLVSYFENYRFSEEDVYDTKLDYRWNDGGDGWSFGAGAEYRTIDRSRDNARTEYIEDGSSMADYALQTGYAPQQLNISLLWIDALPFLDTVPQTLPVDQARTTSRMYQDDFNYVEDTLALYGMASYAGENWKLTGGLRLEDVSNDARFPGEVLTDPFIARSGGYDKILPSAVFSYNFTNELRLKLGASQSVGRPNPGDVARRERRNDVNLTISRGNPDLQPRESTNLDVGLEYFFPDGSGLLSGAVFYKDIEKEIFTATSQQTIDGQIYDVSQPSNARGAEVSGIELGFIKNSFGFLPTPFDGLGFSGNVTFVDGEIEVTEDFTFDRLVEQSEVSGNATVFYNWNDRAEARLSYNLWGDYHDSISTNPANARGWDDFNTIDLTLRYTVNDHVDVKFKARNLLDESRVRIRGLDRSALHEEVMFGQSFFFDVIYKF